MSKLSHPAREKAARVMREFHAGELHSSSGEKVTSEEQAKAIAMSEARRKMKTNDLPHAFRNAVKRFKKLGYLRK